MRIRLVMGEKMEWNELKVLIKSLEKKGWEVELDHYGGGALSFYIKKDSAKSGGTKK